jgi:cytochrome c-type biogenesis protein CcsB
MMAVETVTLALSLIGIGLALLITIVAFLQRQQRVIHAQQTAGTKTNPTYSKKISGLDIMATIFVWFTFLAITITIGSRAIESGHGPFSSMYEFAIAFAWGILLAGIIYRWRYKTGAVMNIGLIVALLLLVFARAQFSRPAELVPALQQSVLLSAHVASAVVAYGTLTIGFGAAIMVLIQSRAKSVWLPDLTTLDTISYHSVLIGFPFLSLLIILGALWADIAWGKYWSWDPKETASLVTWLIYAGYMHSRVLRGWRFNKSAILLIVGFLAIIFTFFGNFIFSGLHAY